MYDAIIIGAGMSGLAAGIRLAMYGKKVCIFERHYAPGGLNSFYRLKDRNWDVGLHALTNFTRKGSRKGPLARMLRSLRFRHDDLALAEQNGSEIMFPGMQLRFSNDSELLESEIATHFPGQIDNFRKLTSRLLDYDQLTQADYQQSARDILREAIADPLLIEMLLCPLMWYGNARERDMDFGQFSIMFRSIFLEGFARPHGGIRPLIKLLLRRLREAGGELKLRTGVAQIVSEGDRAVGVRLDSGEEISAKWILSTVGRPETARLCTRAAETSQLRPGQLSFVEALCALDCQPQDLDHPQTIVFLNDSETFHWERSDELCDVRTGVICTPNNYRYAEDRPPLEGQMRVTAIANYPQWTGLDEAGYRRAKVQWFDRILESAVRFVPDFRPHIVETDMFTPKTITRFTWHDEGAVYGTPDKRLDGATSIDNLWIGGNDHGYVGIVGTMISGIMQANRFLQVNGV